jgi:hypothetical protein
MHHGILVVKEAVVIVEKLEKIRKIMETDNSKLVRFMNWFKKTYPHGTRKTSSMVVHHYIKNPDDAPEEEADPCYTHLDANDTPLPLHYHTDGDGDAIDDFGTGLGGQPLKPEEKRYCKGCHADVTKSMYCHCGDFGLLKSETLSETELNDLENGK